MYRISPFTPLFFHPSRDVSGWEGRYTQVFKRSDRIFMEVIASGETDAPVLTVDRYDADGTLLWSRPVIMPAWRMNAFTTLYFLTLTGLEDGYFTVSMTMGGNTVHSDAFRVTDDTRLLGDTVLIQYGGRDNRRRSDVVFLIDRERYFFDFRVPGGFKDDNWGFGVDSEQYTTNLRDTLDVYSYENETRTLTMGSGYGVPVWYASMLNRILSCPYVYIDGERYVRQESSVPERTQTVEGQRSYIFTQALVRVGNADELIDDTGQVILRRLPGDETAVTYRKANEKPRKIW